MADLATPMAIRVGATLRIADLIHTGTTTVSALATACEADLGALERLLRYWQWLELVTRTDEGGYHLTPLGHQLRDDHPGGRRHWLTTDGGVGRGDLAFFDLLHSVRSGEPAYPHRFGRDFWTDLAEDDRLGESFDTSMRRHVASDNRALTDVLPWQDVRHVVDVGGGTGALLEMLLSAHDHLRGTLVDLPGPARRARKALADGPVAPRVTVREGSFFDPLPTGADAYVLSAILHDWDDTSCVRILRRCAQAAGRSGRVLVIENCGADGESVDPRMDLRMLVLMGGRERGIGELEDLGRAAGLELAGVRRGPDTPHIAVLELRRQEPDAIPDTSGVRSRAGSGT